MKRQIDMKNPLSKLVASAALIQQRRIARRKPSGFDLVLADKIDFINCAHWDQLAAQTVFLTRDYLRVVERFGPSNVVMRYALAYANEQPVAAIVLQRIGVTGDQLRKKQAITSIRGQALKQLDEQLLVCGNVLIWGQRSIAFAPNVDANLIWAAVGEAIYRLRRADKLLGEMNLIMVKDFVGDNQTVQDQLRLLGYRSIDTEPDMVLTIRPEWKTPDDYMASLTSSYRSNVKKLQKDCVNAGVSFELLSADQMQAHAQTLHELYLQVHEGQGLRLATLNPLYLPAMARVFLGRFRCRVALLKGQIVGFVTTVLDNETAIGYYIGYDKPSNDAAPIYLTLLRSCVDDAIEMGAKQLSLGRTALEPKAKMGCLPVPIACAVKHRVSLMNPMVSALTRNVSHDEPPQRNPFKA
jgi:Acetyltransferase (GNAT) domain